MKDFILMEREDLEQAFKEWARDVIQPQEDEILSTYALADYLGYSITWVRQNSARVSRGLEADFPPFHRRGRKILFRKSDVDKWLEKK